MFSVTRLLDVAAADCDRVLTAVRAAAGDSGALRWVVEQTDPGSRNGGDILTHLRFADESHWRAAESAIAQALTDPAITRVNGVSYTGEPNCSGTPGTVYRALLLRVQPGTSDQTVRRFESELRSMPRYVDTIRAWQLSRVIEPLGASPWTHVFEQEFSDVAGLMGPYLMHPIHWAAVDRWFDPETTDVIIRDRVCHSFCRMASPVLHPSS
ncbi:Dabb family protein [[Mycobacterium] burgundiense]|uniref:Dabb family protein n=1 Tax=[Mycobacterium] burgundiense TaxID=3064286 RepID=A0ABN9NS22_9MYCO|nr:Dabb family protein [Mycolicibacterium sp. MU0053]CAJ1510993.1 Dabb family protein [Mycolicibacterium sp. MU0053]